MSTTENVSRKRPAPGASPIGFQSTTQQPVNPYQNGAQSLTDEQFFNWGANGQNPNAYSTQSMYGMPASAYPSQPAAQPSNQLARRPMNQVVPRPPPQNNQWMTEHTPTPLLQQQQQPPPPPPPQPQPQPQPQNLATTWSDDIDELLAKAQAAKREAQSKRKQIPPFVLKLHSFLENPKNTDLIRWSDDGKSFVVLNEDEFANKLIPELFKHNNYASFVRQLNMYGFHKKVGLSDNSMRASERKAKSPSEYWNPFFRRGYPDLLWLIQKPKNQATNAKSKARGKSEEREDEDEYAEDVNSAEPTRMRPQLTMGPDSGRTALTQEQFASIQQELMRIRNQQGQITRVLAQLKHEHDALVNQASDYQNKHSRHEHSINAILTFLATLYNRSLQNHEGTQDIAKIFAQTLSQEKNSGGRVEDQYVFDLPEGTSLNQSQQPYKKARLLLTDGSENRATTMSPSTTAAASPQARSAKRPSHTPRSPQSAHVEEIFDADLNQPSNNYQSPSNQQQQEMMNYIHSANAHNSGKNTPVPDFSNVLKDLENTGGTTPVNAAQRDKMLRMFGDSPGKQFDALPRKSRPGTSDNNALIPPTRNSYQVQFDNRLASTKHDLDRLEQMQADQDKAMDNLTTLLQPLSPTGSIPGIGDGQEIPPPPFDINELFPSTGYFDYGTDTTANANLDFSNLNSDAYNTNANAEQFDFADDGPLFGDVDENKDADKNFFGADNYDLPDADAGKVESLASSSDAPTPKQNENDARDWTGNQAKKRRTS